jgi:SsrA-binding protein
VPQKRPKRPADGRTVVATNRRARRDFDILDTVEAGIVLQGSEVKSLREAQVNLSEAYARIIDGEAWMIGLYIRPYSHAGRADGHDTDRDKKLLLHRKELDRIAARFQQERLTLVPLSLYFNERGRAKVELGIGRGRKTFDKRQAIAKRDSDRDAARAVARVGR